jgi:HEAT repeat protein
LSGAATVAAVIDDLLTAAQRAAVVDRALGRIDDARLVTVLRVDPRVDRDAVPRWLAAAARERDGEQVDSALGVMFAFRLLDSRYVDVLCELVVADWHTGHEDMAASLQDLADPRAVPALRRAAELDLPYRDYDDDVRSLARKCMWALTDIGTAEAVGALAELARSPHPVVRKLAEHHLSKHGR